MSTDLILWNNQFHAFAHSNRIRHIFDYFILKYVENAWNLILMTQINNVSV